MYSIIHCNITCNMFATCACQQSRSTYTRHHTPRLIIHASFQDVSLNLWGTPYGPMDLGIPPLEIKNLTEPKP